MEKNRAIEAYRFIFCLTVCLFHFSPYSGRAVADYPFKGGYLAVEFFFIVSGYLLIKHFADKSKPEDRVQPALAAWQYIKSKYLRLFPHHTLSFLMLGIAGILFWNTPWQKVFINGIWEFFMLGEFGFAVIGMVNTAAWYVSALLMSSLVLYYLLLKDEQRFCYIIAPAMVLIIYSYCLNSGSFLNQYTQYHYFFCTGFFRALAGMSLGCICYKLVQKLKPHTENRFRLLASILESGILIIFFKIVWRGGYTYSDFLIPPLLAVLVISVFCGNSYLSKLLDNGISGLFGRLSYAVYLNQSLLIVLFINYLPGHPYWLAAAAYLAALTAFSFCTDYFTQICVKNVRKRLKKGPKHANNE